MEDFYRYWGKAGKQSADQTPTYHLLPYHSLDVAAVGEVLLKQQPRLQTLLARLCGMDEEPFRQWMIFFLALHDLGKFTDSFQQLRLDVQKVLQGREGAEASARHDSLGFLLWNSREGVKSALQESWALPTGRRRRIVKEDGLDHWIRAVTGHHGQPPKENLGKIKNYAYEGDLPAAKQFVESVRELLLPERPVLPEAEKMKTAAWWISGFTVLCDWLGSNAEIFSYQENACSLDHYWQKVALPRAEKAVQMAELTPSVCHSELDLVRLFGSYMKTPTPLQRQAAECEVGDSPQLFILEDVTGSGKTEAALILSQRLMAANLASGLYFALPTMATSNAMYDRLGAVYRKLYQADGVAPSLVLSHGARQLSESFRSSYLPQFAQTSARYGDETLPADLHCSAWLADNRKKSLLAQVGVGTIDQALLAILPARHQSLRLLGLLDKVLLVDEVHACDSYMHRLLCHLLTAHARAGGSAILLSATLPAHQRQQLLTAYAKGRDAAVVELQKEGLKDYPLLSHWSSSSLSETLVESRACVSRFVSVQFVHQSDEVTELLRLVVEKGQCACWIRNTVKDAMESFDELKAAFPDWNIVLFHARFSLSDRLRIEQEVVQRFGKKGEAGERRGSLLIATQVVEQSLDLDFDYMISDLAPVDLLIQRAGRLQRHSRNVQGELIDGEDQRDEAILTVLSPLVVAEPSAGWFRDFFPCAQKVYEDHAQLWLTARLLQQKGGFSMPEDARWLIEGVYGDEAEEALPEGLLGNRSQAQGAAKGRSSIAEENSLNLDQGYCFDSSFNWWEEALTPTRLADEESGTVYLARWQEGCLQAWAADQAPYQWPYSAVQLRASLLVETVLPEAVSLADYEALQQQLPAQGKWSLLMVLEQRGESWVGRGKNAQGQGVSLSCDAVRGVQVE